MDIKKIKLTAFAISITIGVAMLAVYIFSIVGLNQLVSYHLNAIAEGIGSIGSGGTSREELLSIVRTYRVMSYLLLGFAVALKITSFILQRAKKGDKNKAIILIVISGVNIVIKIASLIVAAPVMAYLNYTDATMALKFWANILFSIAQVVIIVWTALYLIKLGKIAIEENDNETKEVKSA